VRPRILLVTIAALASLPVTAARIAVSPNVKEVRPGESFGLDILATDVSDLFSFQFDLSFDPALLRATDVREGAFLPSGGTTFFVPGVIDNNAGTITFTTDSLIGAIPGVSGNGAIAEIEFQALAPGSSSVSFSNTILLNSGSSVLDAVAVDGVVNISDAVTPIPEPHSALLLTGGIGVLLALAHRSHRRKRRPAAGHVPREPTVV
jgi:general secretion pathway protein D